MTLILTIGNSLGVYQSSDYQLTNPVTGEPVSNRAESKQLEASFMGLNIMLALTGSATVRIGSTTQRTIDYLHDVLKALPPESDLQAVCEALAQKSEKAMRPYGRRGVLTLVLSASSMGQTFSGGVHFQCRLESESTIGNGSFQC